MADQEARDELRRLLDAAAGRLLDAGCSWDEVVQVIGRRLGAAPVAERPELGRDDPQPPVKPLSRRAVGLPDDGRPYWPAPGGGWTPQSPADRDAEDAEPHQSPETFGPETWARVAAASAPAGSLLVPPSALASALASEVMTPEPDRPFPSAEGEPPVGSVVTDTRSRVCWRDEAGWHRSGVEEPMTWHDVCQAVGPDPQNPRQLQAAPGTPVVISQPPQRAQGPTVVRPAGQLEVQVQRPLLGPDGEPLLDPAGRKQLRTETETVQISEVVPAGGQP